jgi:hypothetical protein
VQGHVKGTLRCQNSSIHSVNDRAGIRSDSVLIDGDFSFLGNASQNPTRIVLMRGCSENNRGCRIGCDVDVSNTVC